MPRYSARWLAATTARIADVDILVEFDPDAHVTVFDYVGVKEYIASLFLQPVDVIDREALKPHLRRPSEQDAVYAF
jgi:predicted nucleotidyltransferase